ncbi:hypothetical protein K438DRAFT_1768042 [Mycena galopus ATCC 62051]|nr:hypothetical protein K438DRAFT_1768042 [Mycena galopus ATCC 62051]
MEPKDTGEVFRIPKNLLEKLLPSSNALVQDLLAHKFLYQYPSTNRMDATAYLTEDALTCPRVDATTLAMPPASVIKAILGAVHKPALGVKYMAISCAHIPGNKDTYPLWILTYWAKLVSPRESRKCWEGGNLCTGRTNSDQRVIGRTCRADFGSSFRLTMVLWPSRVPGM